MKTFFNFFSVVFIAMLMTSTTGFAQEDKPATIAEEVKTESSTPTEDIFVDDIVRKRIVVENRLMPQQPIREADISWEKRIQRVIDTREKINLPFLTFSQSYNKLEQTRQFLARCCCCEIRVMSDHASDSNAVSTPYKALYDIGCLINENFSRIIITRRR